MSEKKSQPPRLMTGRRGGLAVAGAPHLRSRGEDNRHPGEKQEHGRAETGHNHRPAELPGSADVEPRPAVET
jgi:hypothetical protein